MHFKTLHLLIINKPYFFQQRNDKEECLGDYPKEIVKQNQFILNLLHQFGDSGAMNEQELETSISDKLENKFVKIAYILSNQSITGDINAKRTFIG